MSYRRDETTGKTIKVTQKIKTIVTTARVNPRVAERKSWAKYGQANQAGSSGDNTSSDYSFTTTATEPFELKLAIRSHASEAESAAKSQAARNAAKLSAGSSIVCRNCGGEHLTAKCPMRKLFDSTSTPGPKSDGVPGPAPATEKTGGAVKSAYVAPHLRRSGAGSAGGSEAGHGSHGNDRDFDNYTLRVTNLGLDMLDEEFRELFRKFGNLHRASIARDYQSGRSKGFGFAVFTDMESARRAQAALNGKPIDNLIISVNFNTKREK